MFRRDLLSTYFRIADPSYLLDINIWECYNFQMSTLLSFFEKKSDKVISRIEELNNIYFWNTLNEIR
jgi:hypothetical protein